MTKRLELLLGFVFCVSLSLAYRLEKQNDSPSERVHIRSVSERSLDGRRTLHLSAFGKEHVLQLKPIEIFTPDFELVQVERSQNGDLEFNRVAQKTTERSETRGQLYTVNDGEGSLFITDDNQLQAEGVINDELRIFPNENDWHNDGSLAHTVHQLRAEDLTSHYDYIIPEHVDVEESTNSVSEDVPAEVTVEVLVVFDYTNSKRLDFDVEKIRKYVGIFWSQIHYRYRDTSAPKINIAVSGLLTFKNPEDEPFIFKHRYEQERVDKDCLSSFKEWLAASKSSLPKHDVALLQLGLSAGFFVDGKWDGSYAGLAYVGTACNTGTNSGFAEDTARLFDGFNGVAHELGHILNCPHDGDTRAKDCPAGAGYVMSGGKLKTFSKCSIEIMRKFVSDDKRSCLRDQPTIAVPLIDVWPVVMVEDLNEQCQLMFGSKDYFFPKKISENYCEKMWCGKKGSSAHYAARGAYEGMPCALNKICLDSKCISKPAPSLDTQCQQRFGNQFKSSTAENICQEVRCADNTGKQESLGRPLAGTPCGSNNFCLNGECYAL